MSELRRSQSFLFSLTLHLRVEEKGFSEVQVSLLISHPEFQSLQIPFGEPSILLLFLRKGLCIRDLVH